ncbi:tyrosine-type recombinase/integrase [Cyclobacterium plantarum]|uniref:tyrosine-type recombinase/integrase n=1 Tax=Cyclobacterium plantarum TaxID=2716263 RepID=UPI003F712150
MEYSYSMFDRFALGENVSAFSITRKLVNKWSEPRPNESPRTRYIRIAHVAQLSGFLCILGHESHIPKLPRIHSSHEPYIFSRDQMAAVFAASDRLMLKCPRHETSISAIPTLFRVLYGTGMRISETLALRDMDVDLEGKTIFIKGAKNGRDRRIPISGSLAEACDGYRFYRDLHTCQNSPAYTFFRSHKGHACPRRSAYTWFRRILSEACIPHFGRGMGPRLHDVRHTYSVHALAKMVEDGLDLYYALPLLSTFLGHRSLDATEQYVRLTSEMYPGLIRDLNAVCGYVFPKTPAP